MGRRPSSLLDELVEAPWWVSVTMAVVAFVSLRYVLPIVASTQSPLAAGVFQGFQQAAGYAAFVLLLPAPFAAFRQLRARRLVDQQTGIHSIKALTWQDFETLVAEMFRRQGYTVKNRGGSQPDGGIDIVLEREGTVLVQCKHWRSQQVGVREARELLGVVHASKAHAGILVTCGAFSPAAEDFAEGQPLTLINGRALAPLLRAVQREPAAAAVAASATASSEPVCPKCGGAMTQRIARRGASAGSSSWGCVSYPRCHGTRRI